MSQWRTYLGITLTVIWLLVMAGIYVATDQGSHPVRLNEWGDFFAGFFAPVAFLWLVLGYLQQGEELRHQAEELRNSVEQQKQLVEVTRLQANAEIDALRHERERIRLAGLPKFIMGGVGASFSGVHTTYHASIENVGNTATLVRLTFGPPMRSCSLTSLPTFFRESSKNFEFSFPEGKATVGYALTVSFVDANGLPGSQSFDLVLFPSSHDPESHNVRFEPSAA